MNENPQTPAPARPYADSVVAYAQAGWPCILPVPPTEKFPPPIGYTGADGRDTDHLTIAAWASGTDPQHPDYPAYSVALRMPDGVIGIDVDQYVKGAVTKNGAATLAAGVERWGPLPATWTSTAREAGGPSRIYFFRTPGGRYAGQLGPDVDIIQRHHRYAVVWPSPHHSAKSLYRWYGPDGNVSDHPPKPTELPELPEAWHVGLSEGASQQAPASAGHGDGRVLLDQLADDWRPECAELASARLTALDAIRVAAEGNRHQTMNDRLYPIVQLAAGGHTGVAAAFLELRDLWAQVTAGENRTQELEDSLLGAARKAVTVVGSHQVPRDPCLLVQGFPAPMPPAAPAAGSAPADPDADPVSPDLTIVEPPRWYSVRELIGTHSFDPLAGLDQTLAEAVLARTYPMLRFAYDARGWLLRQPERWELHGDLAAWGVSQTAQLMPMGDPTAEKDSDAYARHQRRTRLMTNAGAKAVAAKMGDLVAGGLHPAAVSLGGLDADPELLWAGGVAWSLRDSVDYPQPAEVDPTTPHMHSAALAPQRVPTPLWDAFLAAVWPDPATRAWSLRVMAVCLTGHADRALPILLGETGRGKTQLVVLMMSVLGSYAHAANPKLLLSNSNNHDSIIFALKGRRMSFIDEGPSERKSGQERLKQLTGGGELTANAMHKDPVTFRPTHTLVLTTNDEPVLTDPAVRSRARLLPCNGDPEEVRRTRAAIGSLSGPAWRREAPGVLAAMMIEASGWLRDPSSGSTDAAPEGIRYLAEGLAVEQDPVATWLLEETEKYVPGTSSRELYQAFRASAQASGTPRDQVPNETRWGKALTLHGFPPIHTRLGNLRAIRVRMGGFREGLTPSGEGFVNGLAVQPLTEFSQVNPPVSEGVKGSEGFFSPSQVREETKNVQGGETQTTPQPFTVLSADSPESAPPELHEPESLHGPATAKKRAPRKPVDPELKRQRTEAARAKRAEASAAKRFEAVRLASGAEVPLPAVATRDAGAPGGVRILACRADQADALLATITDHETPDLTIDVETTGYPVGHADYALRTIQLGNEQIALVLDAADPEQVALAGRHLRSVIEKAGVLHAHSATADLVPMAVLGQVDFEAALERMIDTAVLAKLADPTSTDNSADLKGLAKAVLRGPDVVAVSPDADKARIELFKAGNWLTDTEVTTDPERSGWGQVDHRTETMVRYDASDVLDCSALAKRLPALNPTELAREQLAQTMTARIAYRGVRIDGDQVGALLPVHEEAKARYAERITGAYGIENPGSPTQVGARMVALGARLPHTPTGKPSVAEGVLEPLVGDRAQPPTTAVEDLARLMIDWREHDTALKLFLRPYDVLVRRGDGRARPTVYTLGAKTGRMSCVRPNLQQLPREGGFRACITADPGYLLVSADFASVELRVAAALSGDQRLLRMLEEADAHPEAKNDLHWQVARIAFGPEATKANRYAAKRGVFGRIYGGGVKAIAAGVGVTDVKARAIIDAMDALTPGLTEWSRMTRDGIEAGRTRFQAYSGRTIHLPKAAAHAGPNYCIQGTARELLIDSLERWRQTPWAGCTLWPVHDEVVVMVPEAEAAEATAALVQCMTSTLFGVQIKAEASEPTFAWADSV